MWVFHLPVFIVMDWLDSRSWFQQWVGCCFTRTSPVTQLNKRQHDHLQRDIQAILVHQYQQCTVDPVLVQCFEQLCTPAHSQQVSATLIDSPTCQPDATSTPCDEVCTNAPSPSLVRVHHNPSVRSSVTDVYNLIPDGWYPTAPHLSPIPTRCAVPLLTL
jgi:hypothetical protein